MLGGGVSRTYCCPVTLRDGAPDITSQPPGLRWDNCPATHVEVVLLTECTIDYNVDSGAVGTLCKLVICKGFEPLTGRIRSRLLYR